MLDKELELLRKIVNEIRPKIKPAVSLMKVFEERFRPNSITKIILTKRNMVPSSKRRVEVALK